jgi:mannose-6-phosphate isomerase
MTIPSDLLQRLLPVEAGELLCSPALRDAWLAEHGVAMSEEVILQIADRVMEEPPMTAANRRRGDFKALREFARKAVGLPVRQRQVAMMCFERGATIDECAAAMGIGRETVRSHLAALRTSYGYSLANRRRADAWSAGLCSTAMSRVVDKPWGHELIWAHTDRYVGKILHIKAGERLSLQYHRQKDETIMVLSGRLMFESFAEGEPPSARELAVREPFHITPGLRHRMIALEDTDVVEVSTPELDDVVRLDDKYGRAQ